MNPKLEKEIQNQKYLAVSKISKVLQELLYPEFEYPHLSKTQKTLLLEKNNTALLEVLNQEIEKAFRSMVSHTQIILDDFKG